MGKKLYVGNLSYSINDDDLRQMFAEFGNVLSAQVIIERDSKRSKGFGFVEMASDEDAQAAIAAMHTKNVAGRALTVNIARPPEPKSGGNGQRRGGRGGGGKSFSGPRGGGNSNGRYDNNRTHSRSSQDQQSHQPAPPSSVLPE